MDIAEHIFFNFIEGIILIVLFSALIGNRRYMMENKLSTVLFIIQYAIINCIAQYSLPLSVHAIVVVILSIFLLAYMTKSSFANTIVVYSIFFIIVTVVELSVTLFSAYIFKTTVNKLMENQSQFFIMGIIAMSVEIAVTGVIYGSKLSLPKIKIFNKEYYILSNIVIEAGVLAILTGTLFIGSMIKKNIMLFSLLIILIYLTLLIVKYLDYKEREEMAEIFRNYTVQQNHVLNLEETLSAIRQEKHDFANHIGVISGICALNNQDSVERINAYIKSITKDLHETSRIFETGNNFLDGLLCVKFNQARLKGVSLDVTINKQLDNICVKNDELISIIGNLMDNALDALMSSTKEDNKGIYFTTFEDKGKIFIEIANNGDQISEENIDKIFNKGFSTKMKDKTDCGFGLFIVKQLVEKYNGHISVESDAEETSFLLEFP